MGLIISGGSKLSWFFCITCTFVVGSAHLFSFFNTVFHRTEAFYLKVV